MTDANTASEASVDTGSEAPAYTAGDFETTTSEIEKIMIQFMDGILTQDSFQKDYFHKSQENYCAFINAFVKCIVPSSRFKEMINGSHSTFAETITPHDEGLALLILDNNFLKWKAEASKKLAKSKETGQHHPSDLKDIDLSKDEVLALPKARYTMGQAANTNLRSGWKREALMDHVKLVKMVMEFRAKEEFDTYKSFAANCIANKNARPRKRQRQDNGSEDISIDEAAKRYDEYTKEFFTIHNFTSV